MKCSDTGEQEAILLPDLDLPLAQDVNDAVRGVKTFGHGNGQVILNIVNGIVQSIDCTMRRHRKPPKKKGNEH